MPSDEGETLPRSPIWRSLNSAVSDIYCLRHAMLARVWKAQRFSLWMTTMLNTFPDSVAYDQKLQDTDLAYLFSTEMALLSAKYKHTEKQRLTRVSPLQAFSCDRAGVARGPRALRALNAPSCPSKRIT